MNYIPASDDSWIQGDGYRKQILLEEAELRCPVTLVQLVVIDPHCEVPFHYHERMTEVFHIIEGEGRMTIAGHTLNLAPGDTVTTQPKESHNAINAFDTPLRYIVFKTNASAGDSVWPTVD